MENKSLPSSTDEGFEDSRSGDFIRSPPLSQIPFIDFRKSKENQGEEVIHFHKNISYNLLCTFLNSDKFALFLQSLRKLRNRGEELLEMIKLDFMEWSLLECSPIPYDEFIRNYGKLNTQQVCNALYHDCVIVCNILYFTRCVLKLATIIWTSRYKRTKYIVRINGLNSL